MKVNSFTELKVWTLAMEISKRTYLITNSFPGTERYGLVSQMRRAAVSVPSNIAEGFNRGHKNDFHRFLLIALGSLGELETQFLLSYDLKFLKKLKLDEMRDLIIQESKMLKSLKNKLLSTKD